MRTSTAFFSSNDIFPADFFNLCVRIHRTREAFIAMSTCSRIQKFTSALVYVDAVALSCCPLDAKKLNVFPAQSFDV